MGLRGRALPAGRSKVEPPLSWVQSYTKRNCRGLCPPSLRTPRFLLSSLPGGGILCSSDRKVLRTARREFGQERVAGPVDVLIWAVQEGRVGRGGAESLLPTLDVGLELVTQMSAAGMTFYDLVKN